MDKTTWKCIDALYGNGTPPAQIIRSSSGDPESEARIQAKFVTYLQKNNILFYHVPNGGYREKKEAYSLKLQGVQPGVPDIVIPIARKPYHGLYIELKRKSGGVTSSAQRWWLNELNLQGYAAFVAKGLEEAINLLLAYLERPRWEQ